MNLIATIPFLGSLREQIAQDPNVTALRFNLSSPVGGHTPQQVVGTLSNLAQRVGKPIWFDLKGRQLRITRWADPSVVEITLSHPIEVDLPCALHFRDHTATIVAVRGNTIVIEEPPEYAVGAGQAVNILDPSLRIGGSLTDTDLEYLVAMEQMGERNIMLSFCESQADIAEVRSLIPEAIIAAKIESKKGVEFVEGLPSPLDPKLRLMLARDDMFTHLGPDKFRVGEVERLIIDRDRDAIVASRILESLEKQREPSLGDVKDLLALYERGYRTFMIGDGICKKREPFERAIHWFRQFQNHIETASPGPEATVTPDEETPGSRWAWLRRRGKRDDR